MQEAHTLPYRIEYSPEAEDHLRRLTIQDQRLVLDTVDIRLSHQPTHETKNRKPMRPNPVAPWELRMGELRVYYDVQVKPEPLVRILAVGIKQRDQVLIGKEVIKL